MKALIRVITGIASIVLLFVCAVDKATPIVFIVLGLCAGWLALVGFATWRKGKKHV